MLQTTVDVHVDPTSSREMSKNHDRTQHVADRIAWEISSANLSQRRHGRAKEQASMLIQQYRKAFARGEHDDPDT